MAGLYHSDFVARLTKGVQRLKHHWGVSASAKVKLLTLSENATFIVEDEINSRSIIVRVHRPNYHTYAEIASEIAWIEALRKESDIKIPAPLPMGDGAFIATFNDEGQTRHMVAFEFMTGKEPSTDDTLTQGFELLGRISGELHNHSSQWTPPANFTRKSWTFETAFGANPLWGDWRQALDLGADEKIILEQLCQVLKEKLDQYGKQSDRFGLIHADLRLANLLLDTNQLSVIDFDDCGFSWFMYDFASAISFYEDSAKIPELTLAWLQGYKRARSLSQEHEDMIPTFILFRRLLLTAWIASHAETETAAEAGLGDYTKGTVKLAKQYLDGSYLKGLYLKKWNLETSDQEKKDVLKHHAERQHP